MEPVSCDCGWTRGALAARAILEKVHRVEVAKQLDPLDPGDYLVIVQRLAAAVRSSAEPREAQAIRGALRRLDVDWPNLSAAQRAAAFAAAREALRNAAPGVLRSFSVPIRGPRGAVFGPARASAVRALPRRLRVTTSLSARDRRAERILRTSTTNFVRDELGRRVDDLSELAREIVARGLEEGLGRDEIAANLAGAMGGRIARSEAYYEVVAGAYVNRARTYSQLLTYQDAGVERYVFEAVLDEVTTDICRFYHGQTFQTSAGLASMDRVLALEDPESIVDENPWLRTGRLPSGERHIFFERGDRRVSVARIDRSGVGTRDERGSFSGAMSPRQLEAAGIPYPPLHGRCRSTIVADV